MNRFLLRRLLLIAPIVVTAALAALAQTGSAPPYDLVLRGGTVVDGTGGPRFRADVAIKGDRVARVDRDRGPQRLSA